MVRIAEHVRFYTRMSAFVGFLLLSMVTLVLLRAFELCTWRRIDRAPFVRRYFVVLCWLLGMRVQTHGCALENSALRVSNHVSWTDIPILGARLPLRFLAKREVASWPLIGWIARHAGTLFFNVAQGMRLQSDKRLPWPWNMEIPCCYSLRGRPAPGKASKRFTHACSEPRSRPNARYRQ